MCSYINYLCNWNKPLLLPHVTDRLVNVFVFTNSV
jgi:hypothetical protein